MDHRPEKCEIIIFARLPRPGQVKTRLAASIGPEAACKFYKACADHTILTACCSLTHDESIGVTVYHSRGDSDTEVMDWIQDVCSTNGAHMPAVRCQSADPDLGVKMHQAMSQALCEPGVGKVIIIGTDIPDISAATLEKAKRALDHHDVVLGPAVDGGYYLMGLRGKADPRLFQDIAWSTESVLASTVERIQNCMLSSAPLETLPKLRDVDVIEDLKQWLLYGGQSSSLDTVGMHIQGATEINGSESACSSHRYLNLKRLASKLIDTSTSDC